MNSNPKIAGVFKAWEENGDKLTNLEKNAELKSIILAETPWLRDAQSDAEKKQRIAQLFDLKKLATEQQEILKKLENQQLDNGAFPWFSGGSPNLFITQHILAGLGHLHKLGVEIDAETLEYSAIQYLDSDLLSRFAQHEKSSRDEAGFYKNPALLHYLYARSFYLKEHPFNEQLSRIAGKTMEFHKTAWSQNSNYKNALLALIASRMGDKAFAKKILTGLKESAVQSSENGMYWKTTTSNWWWYDAPIETQALFIEAFSEITEDTKTIEELKIWLLQNKRTNSWQTTKSTTEINNVLAVLQGNIERSQKALNKISNSIHGINEQMDKVAGSTNQQSSTIEQISSTVKEFSAQMGQTTNAVTETSAATNSMADEAGNLAQQISRFKL